MELILFVNIHLSVCIYIYIDVNLNQKGMIFEMLVPLVFRSHMKMHQIKVVEGTEKKDTRNLKTLLEQEKNSIKHVKIT